MTSHRVHLTTGLMILALLPLAAAAAGEPEHGIFVRVENLSDQPMYARLVVVLHRQPFGYGWGGDEALYISRAGLVKRDVPAPQQWLGPGEQSPWVDVTSLSIANEGDDGRDEGTFAFLTMTEKDASGKLPAPLAVAVAHRPADDAIIRRVSHTSAIEPLALIIRNDVKRHGSPTALPAEVPAPAPAPQAPLTQEQRARIEIGAVEPPAARLPRSDQLSSPEHLVFTVQEDAQRTLDFVKALNLPGKRPEKIKVVTASLAAALPFSDVTFPETAAVHMEVLGRLGFNTIGCDLSQRELAARNGMRFLTVGADRAYRVERSRFAQAIDWRQTEEMIAAMAQRWRRADALSSLAYIHLDDEPSYPTLEEMRRDGPSNQAFREHLRQLGYRADQLVAGKILDDLRNRPSEFLFVEAEQFDAGPGGERWEVRDAAECFGGKAIWCEWFDGLREMQKQISIPESGLYRIWVRRHHTPGTNAIFHVEIRQGDDASDVFCGAFGLSDATTSTSAGAGWESFDAWLESGGATVTIRKRYGKEPWSDRFVDCVLLTTDTTYKPDDAALRKTLAAGAAQWQGPPMGDALDPWHYVTVAARDAADTDPLLYYLSCEFRRGELTRIFANYTHLLRKHVGPDVPTSASLSVRCIVDGAVCSIGPDWFGMGRHNDVSLPAAATGFYYLPEAGAQLVSFVGDVLRGGAQSHTERTGRWNGIGYWILGFGSALIDWMRLETYSILGRGATSIDYYQYGPKAFMLYDFYQENLGKVKVVGELAHEIGLMEEMGLADARPVEAQVALIFSHSTDYRELARNSSVMWHELQWLYLALRHLHHQADIVSEHEVADDVLNRRKYKAAYVVATHLTPQAADALTRWVESGGVLFYEGGAFRDHVNRPLPSLSKLFGTELVDGRYDPKLISAADLWREPPAANDDPPTISVNSFGQGQTILSNTLLGSAYVRGAKPEELSSEQLDELARMAGADKHHFRTIAIPQNFSASSRKLIEMPLRLANVQSVAWTSQPLVEVNAMRLADGWLILLSDYTRQQRAVDLHVRVPAPPSRIRLLHGDLEHQSLADNVLQLRVPIQLTQAIRVYYK